MLAQRIALGVVLVVCAVAERLRHGRAERREHRAASGLVQRGAGHPGIRASGQSRSEAR